MNSLSNGLLMNDLYINYVTDYIPQFNHSEMWDDFDIIDGFGTLFVGVSTLNSYSLIEFLNYILSCFKCYKQIHTNNTLTFSKNEMKVTYLFPLLMNPNLKEEFRNFIIDFISKLDSNGALLISLNNIKIYIKEITLLSTE